MRRLPFDAGGGRLVGALLGVATLGVVAEARRLRSVPLLPSVAHGLDTVVDVDAALRDGRAAAYLAVLGDSVAAGVGVSDVTRSFPHALATRMAAALGAPVRVRSLGVTGARIGDVAERQVPRLVAADGAVPEVVVLSVGVNDVTHLTPPRRFAEDLEAVLRRCRDLGARPVVTGLPDFRALAVLSPPLRYAGHGFGQRVHRAQRAVTERVEGATFVDVKRAVGATFRGDPRLLASDRFHPSVAGCGCLADAVAPAVIAALAE